MSKGGDWLTMSHEALAAAAGDIASIEGDLPRMAAVVQIRAALATEEAAVAQRSTARWTKWLAITTGLLVAATATFSLRAMLLQADTLRELRRQNCLARVELTVALGQGVGMDSDVTFPALLAEMSRCGRP